MGPLTAAARDQIIGVRSVGGFLGIGSTEITVQFADGREGVYERTSGRLRRGTGASQLSAEQLRNARLWEGRGVTLGPGSTPVLAPR